MAPKKFLEMFQCVAKCPKIAFKKIHFCKDGGIREKNDPFRFPPPPETTLQCWIRYHRVPAYLDDECYFVVRLWILYRDANFAPHQEWMPDSDMVKWLWSMEETSDATLVKKRLPLYETLTRACRMRSAIKTSVSATTLEGCMLEFFDTWRSAFLDLHRKHKCWHCLSVSSLQEKTNKKCGGCRKARYCSEACQDRHWKHIHSETCALMLRESSTVDFQDIASFVQPEA